LRDGALEGEGKPEKLKYIEGEYSRRIDEKNRLTYRILKEGKIEILSCKGHYGGK
jgi:toxin YoeB